MSLKNVCDFASRNCNDLEVSSSANWDGFSLTWKIQNFSLCPTDVDMFIHSPSISGANATWVLIVYPKGESHSNNEGIVEVFLKKVWSNIKEHDVVFKIFFKDADGAGKYVHEDRAVFKGNGFIWGFPSVDRDVLLGQEKEKLLSDDTLTICCEFFVRKVLADSAHKEQKWFNTPCSIVCLSELSNDLADLYGDKKLCDVTLKVNDEKIPAHRVILAARSPVFATMLDHDMEETGNSEVCISDIEPSIVKSLLWFMYAGKVSDMSVEKAMKLFKAADKYAIQELKAKCVDFLSLSLSVDNFYDIANLSDTYDNAKLNETLTNFLHLNLPEMMLTKQWEVFLHDKPDLVAVLFQALSVKSLEEDKGDN